MSRVILGGIRATLLSQGSATKAELSRRLQISFPTVSKFLAQMERDGELIAVGMDDSSGGRRAKRYAYNPEHVLGLAVFLERTETHYAVFNGLGEVKEQGQAPSFLLDGVQRFAEHVEEIAARYPKIRALAIGVPGSVNQGRIIHIPDYEAFRDFDLKGYFEDRLAIPVVVENDMNAAVLGYHARKSDRDNPSLVYLYFGQNGPGAGILINGNIVRGSTFFSGEVSFVPQYDDRSFGDALNQGGVSEKGRLGGEEIDAVSRLVASFAAILNPHAVIFNRDEVSDDVIDRIASRSAAYIPEAHLPALDASDWRQDYLFGLQHLGRSLMISAPYRA
ncbi:ROK family transcriptional regulator [Cohnella nanjingensis]|nr:ROK family transcriptional regulator [Cohnella nanjingensis]